MHLHSATVAVAADFFNTRKRAAAANTQLGVRSREQADQGALPAPAGMQEVQIPPGHTSANPLSPSQNPQKKRRGSFIRAALTPFKTQTLADATWSRASQALLAFLA